MFKETISDIKSISLILFFICFITLLIITKKPLMGFQDDESVK